MSDTFDTFVIFVSSQTSGTRDMTLIPERKKNLFFQALTAKRNISDMIPTIIYILAVLAFVKNHYSLFSFPLDDAWIHGVYARSLAFGHGFAYNFGRQEAGSTSPLWSIITAPAHWLVVLNTNYVVLAVKSIGIILGLVCVLTTQRIALLLTGSKPAGLIAASLFAIEPKLLFSTLSGMETCLLAAILTSACALLLTEKHPLFFLFLIGLAPVVRPEALALLPLSLAGIGLIWRTDKRIQSMITACLTPILPTIIWGGFCLYATGHVLPNTFYLKAHRFSMGVPELQVGFEAITQHGLVSPGLLLGGVISFCLLCLKRKISGAPPFLFLIIAPIVYALGVVGSRKVILEGYYWSRWVDPASLLFTIAFCIGYGFILALALDDIKGIPGKIWLHRRSMIKILISSLGLLFMFMSIPTFMGSYTNRRNQLASDSRAIDIMNVQMGKWIENNTAKDAVVGVNDAGAIRYFGQRHTIDLLGLNNCDIAFGKITLHEAISRTDWLAIFPLWFDKETLSQILDKFEPRVEIRIPLQEYTICNAPSQTLEVAFQKKAPTK